MDLKNIQKIMAKGDFLKSLSVFVRFAEELSKNPKRAFQNTADSLRIDKTSVSRHIRKLEISFTDNFLPISLISGRGTEKKITEKGKLCLKLTKEVLGVLNELVEKVNDVPNKLLIGASSTTIPLIFRTMKILEEQHKIKLTLSIIGTSLKKSRVLIETRGFDFALVRSDNKPDCLDSKELGKAKLYLVHKDNQVREFWKFPIKQKTAIVELSQYPLFLYRRSSYTRSRIDWKFEEYNCNPNLKGETTGKTMSLDAVREGLGMTIISLLLPEHREEIESNGMFCEDITDYFDDKTKFWIVWKKGRNLNKTHSLIIDNVIDQANQLLE